MNASIEALRTPRAANRFQTIAAILRDRGVTITQGTRVLDFGCGDGVLVREARELGCDAFGCDIDFDADWINIGELRVLRSNGRVRQITRRPYILPFPSNYFDVVISDQVFEHVADYEEALREIARVTARGGVGLHLFPSRYRLIEGHEFVPLAGFFRPLWWLKMWAALGVRNRYKRGMSIAESAAATRRFLRQGCNYLSGHRIRQEFTRYFRVDNAEREFMRNSPRARIFGTAWLYRNLWTRAVFTVKP